MQILPLTPEQYQLMRTFRIDTEAGIVYDTKGNALGTLEQRDGYHVIYLVHRYVRRSHIIWWKLHDEWPTYLIDHKDQVKDNDRSDNLVKSDHVGNKLNSTRKPNKSGLPAGVRKGPKGTFRAVSTENYVLVDLGLHPTVEAAASAHEQRRKERLAGYHKTPS